MKTLEAMIEEDEGFRSRLYKDKFGNQTIGFGSNISAGFSKDRARALMRYDLAVVKEVLSHKLPFWNTLSPARQNVLLNMGYNLGVEHLLEFKKFLAAMERGGWEGAAYEMLDSLWASQVGDRAKRLAEIIKTGVM